MPAICSVLVGNFYYRSIIGAAEVAVRLHRKQVPKAPDDINSYDSLHRALCTLFNTKSESKTRKNSLLPFLYLRNRNFRTKDKAPKHLRLPYLSNILTLAIVLSHPCSYTMVKNRTGRWLTNTPILPQSLNRISKSRLCQDTGHYYNKKSFSTLRSVS